MAPIVSSIDIARPPDDVFAYVCDPSRFGDWQADVVACASKETTRPASARGSRPPGGSVASSGR